MEILKDRFCDKCGMVYTPQIETQDWCILCLKNNLLKYKLYLKEIECRKEITIKPDNYCVEQRCTCGRIFVPEYVTQKSCNYCKSKKGKEMVGYSLRCDKCNRHYMSEIENPKVKLCQLCDSENYKIEKGIIKKKRSYTTALDKFMYEGLNVLKSLKLNSISVENCDVKIFVEKIKK